MQGITREGESFRRAGNYPGGGELGVQGITREGES